MKTKYGIKKYKQKPSWSGLVNSNIKEIKTMNKEITFVTENGFKELNVNLDLLKGTAKKMAELVYTTYNRDDLGSIRVTSPMSNREHYIKELKSASEIEEIERIWGTEMLNIHRSFIWSWDRLKKHETTEQYFMRHAESIDNIGGTISSGY